MRSPPIRWPALFSIVGIVACASPALDRSMARPIPDAGAEFSGELGWHQAVAVTGSEAQATGDGLVQVEAPNSFGYVFLELDEPGLRRFDQMILGSVRISYASGGQIWKEDKELSLKDYLRLTIEDELAERNIWKIAEAPGEGVLLVRVTVTDVDVERKKGLAVGPNSFFLAAGGEAILTLDLMDSNGPRPLVRIVEARKLRPGAYAGHMTDYERLKHVFRIFSRSAGETVQWLYSLQ